MRTISIERVPNRQGGKGNMAELNDRIRIARTLAGVSQGEVAREIGVMQSVVVRYEQGRRPTDGNLQRLAAFVGLPLEWFWVKPFSGIFTFRPEMPGQNYSSPAVRMKETALARDWPLLLDMLDINNVVILKSGLGGAVIAHNDAVCFAVIGTHSVDTIRRITANLPVQVKHAEITDTDFLNAWFQPGLLYLKKLLSAAEAGAWAKQVDEGNEGPGGAEWRVELSVVDYDSDEKFHEKEDAELEGKIIDALQKANISVTNVSIRRVTATIEGAPAGWSYISRS